MWNKYINAASIEEVLDLLAVHGRKARIIAGATDLLLEIERGQRQGIDLLVDISRIAKLDEISLDDQGFIHLGPLVTHNQCVNSKILREFAYPLVSAAWEVGSPQIRNRGTVAGNILTASPANDTISPLMSLGAVVVLRSKREERVVPFKQLFTGVRKSIISPDEVLVDIVFPKMHQHQKGIFIKYALRRAQAISVINITILVEIIEEYVKSASITLGAVAPTIIHAEEAVTFLLNKKWDEGIIEPASALIMKAATPIDDLRSSANYRSEMVRTMAARALKSLLSGNEINPLPERPVLLSGTSSKAPRISETSHLDRSSVINTRINGVDYAIPDAMDKTLLRLIREDALLTGTKEGCSEGECGACTVFLDGIAVMSCMVPAGRAHGAEIITIEGVGTPEHLHPVQEGLVSEGAIQCGYCTPGFVMSGVKLLEEITSPNQDEIRQAITGNLCRCTGYYKIIRGIERAAKRGD